MSKPEPLLFKVGQFAELRSFIPGFRGAWFRCELKDFTRSKGQIKYQVKYYDYDDGLDWIKLYEVPRSRKGSSKRKRELMLRPQFPSIYHEHDFSDMNAISDIAIVVDGGWSVGDMVDWLKDGCFWSGSITKFLDDDTVEVKLPDIPIGEGLRYNVSCKELRPSLNWSPDFGWAFPSHMEGRNGHSHARLIQPVKQAPLSTSLFDVLVENNKNAKAAPRSSLELDDSISSHTSTSSLPLLSRLMRSKGSPKLTKSLSGKDRQSCSDSVSSTYTRDALTEVPVASSGEKDLENVSAKKKRLSEAIPLNSTSCDTMEAAIIDMEELVCRVKWLKQILKSGNPSMSADKKWEFQENPADSAPKPSD